MSAPCRKRVHTRIPLVLRGVDFAFFSSLPKEYHSRWIVEPTATMESEKSTVMLKVHVRFCWFSDDGSVDDTIDTFNHICIYNAPFTPVDLSTSFPRQTNFCHPMPWSPDQPCYDSPCAVPMFAITPNPRPKAK
jgi:hypothetical protein